MRVKVFEKAKREGTYKSPTCRLIYPSLFEPTNMKGQTTDADEKKLKYRLTMLVPKDADLTVLKTAMKEILGQQSKKDQDGARLPILKTEEIESLKKYAEDFPITLRCTSKYKPDVVGPNTMPIEESDAYSGRWGRAVINPYWYPSIDGGKPGISLGINSAQYLDHDDPIGGARVAASDDFDPVTDDEPSGQSSNSMLD